MQHRLHPIALALLSLSIAACGKQGEQGNQMPGGAAYASVLADAATRECRQAASAPGAGNEAQLQQICDCTRDKIVAAKPGPFEDEESRRTKMKDALDGCVAEVGAGSSGS